MRVDGAVVMLTMVIFCESGLVTARSAGTARPLCGSNLSDIMSRICLTYNSPGDDMSDRPAGTVRLKRDLSGIVDECCNNICTWEQLKQYCADSANSAETFEMHLITDRSAEGSEGSSSKGVLSPPAVVVRSEVGRVRSRSGRYGRGRRGRRARLHARRCRCRRKRRSGRRRPLLMGNTGIIRNVMRAAPVVGTVSPLLTWAHTIDTDLRPRQNEHFAYITV